MWKVAGYYLQMVAAFLLLAVVHYFAAAFLPVADCDETYNFVEPIHYLLYGTGKQTWENCPEYALRSWLFSWVYAWPAVFVRGTRAISSVDVYFFLRIFAGRVACLAQLFFVYSVWSAFSGRVAMIALMLLILNYPIPHAAASVLPTSFVMCCYFVALGCWLRTGSCTSRTWKPTTSRQSNSGSSSSGVSGGARAASSRAPAGAATKKSSGTVKAPAQQQPGEHSSPRSAYAVHWCVAVTVFMVVLACIAGWPFAGLVAVPIGLDLLFRFPAHSFRCLILSLMVIGGTACALDTYYFCRPVLSAWNVVKYNVFGGAERGPDLYGVEPWFYFLKNLLLNFHLLFLAAVLAPLLVLAMPARGVQRHAASSSSSSAESEGVSRGRQLLYLLPFFLWFTFWMLIAHKEERFMAPAYPFLLLAATIAIGLLFFPAAPETAAKAKKSDRASSSTAEAAHSGHAASASSSVWHTVRFVLGVCFLLLFGSISFSRAMAIYHFYSGPQRLLYDWFPLLQAEAKAKQQTAVANGATDASSLLFTVCVGKEWYRFPSSFFLDSRTSRYAFIKTNSFSGMLPVEFTTVPVMVRPDTGDVEVGNGGLLTQQPSQHPMSALRASVLADPSTVSGACACGAAGVNDLNRAIPEQYAQDVVRDCDVVFDSLAPSDRVSPEDSAAERSELSLEAFPFSVVSAERWKATLPADVPTPHAVSSAADATATSLSSSLGGRPPYAVLDADRTPMWCRVLYYPLGVSERCAVWRPLVLQAKHDTSITA